jgi:hypothetical protein
VQRVADVGPRSDGWPVHGNQAKQRQAAPHK